MFFVAFFIFLTFHSFFNSVVLIWCLTRRIKIIFKIVRLFWHCWFQIFFILISVFVRNVDKSFFILSWNHVNLSLTMLFLNLFVTCISVRYFRMTNFKITHTKIMIKSKINFYIVHVQRFLTKFMFVVVQKISIRTLNIRNAQNRSIKNSSFDCIMSIKTINNVK